MYFERINNATPNPLILAQKQVLQPRDHMYVYIVPIFSDKALTRSFFCSSDATAGLDVETSIDFKGTLGALGLSPHAVSNFLFFAAIPSDLSSALVQALFSSSSSFAALRITNAEE